MGRFTQALDRDLSGIHLISSIFLILGVLACLVRGVQAWLQPWARELWSQLREHPRELVESDRGESDSDDDQPIRVPRFSVAIVLTFVLLVMKSAWSAAMKDAPADHALDMESYVSDLPLFIVILLPLLPSKTANALGLNLRILGENFKAGVTGFWLSVVPTLLATLLVLIVERNEHQQPLLKVLREEPTLLNIFGVVFIAVICAPLLEELMFRVVLQTWLREFLPKPQAVLLTAGLFAGVHGMHAFPLLPLSLILGLTYLRTGSYWSSVVTHAIFNGANILLLLATA